MATACLPTVHASQWTSFNNMFGGGGGFLYGEGNGHMGSPCGQNDGQTPLKTLPCRNLVGS